MLILGPVRMLLRSYLLIKRVNYASSPAEQGGHDERSSCKVRRREAAAGLCARAGRVLASVLERGDRSISPFAPQPDLWLVSIFPVPPLTSQIVRGAASPSPAARAQCVKIWISSFLKVICSKLKGCGDASQFDLNLDALFRQGYSEAGAAQGLWERVPGDGPSGSNAPSSSSSSSAAAAARARCVQEQGLLWQPVRAVCPRDAGEARRSQLSSRGGDERAGWEDTRCKSPSDLLLFKHQWLFAWRPPGGMGPCAPREENGLRPVTLSFSFRSLNLKAQANIVKSR